MKKKTTKTIYTIGHSNVSIDTFLTKLADHKINTLVDVRTIPLSRFYPQFSQNALQKALTAKNIQYLWKGQNLGGRGVNVGYEDTIDEVDINDTYRHSKWLSLMSNRLILAKNLLKPDGVLIVAIDDNEVHRLRLLIEEIMPSYETSSIMHS